MKLLKDEIFLVSHGQDITDCVPQKERENPGDH